VRGVGQIREKRWDVGEPSYSLTIGLGVLKNAGRFETFLEKAVELGVSKVIPIATERVVRKSINRARCERVMIAGLKQSMRSRLPELTGFVDLLSFLRADDVGLKLVAHEGAPSSSSLITQAEPIRVSEKCAILIGPEGGFSERELESAVSLGWAPVSLGASRLRAETAAITVAGVIHMIKSRE